MPKYLEITLEKRRVICRARLLEEDAPITSRAIWEALPQSGDVFHAKYANNEIYTLVEPFARLELENPTLTPLPGDVCYFYFPIGHVASALRDSLQLAGVEAVVDLALFYGRNNLLLSPATGFVPANVFASVTEGLEEFAAACHDVWERGRIGETLTFRQAL